MTLSFNTFIPNDPKLAVIAFLAPMAVSATINMFFAKNSKEAFQYATLCNPAALTCCAFFKGKKEFLKDPKTLALNAITSIGSYCLYKAMQTKSPYFIIPAAILTALTIAFSAGVSADR